MRSYRTALLVLLLALAAAACGPGTGSEDADMTVVATTSIWGDVLTQLVGDDAAVEVLIPRGGDAHEYQPTSRQAALIQEADLVVANGLGLETGLNDVLEGAAEEGANVFEVAPELDPIPFVVPTHEHEAGEEPEHEHEDGLDPHVWFDPERVARAAHLIADRLSQIDDSVDWAARADEYETSLLEADRQTVGLLDVIPDEDRKLVTNHEALGYFADRYGFELVAVVIPGGSSLGEPSPADLADLVSRVREADVNTIFAETTRATQLAETVAAEVGSEAQVVELYTESLGEPGSEAESLIGMLVTNATLVADALSS